MHVFQGGGEPKHEMRPRHSTGYITWGTVSPPGIRRKERKVWAAIRTERIKAFAVELKFRFFGPQTYRFFKHKYEENTRGSNR